MTTERAQSTWTKPETIGTERHIVVFGSTPHAVEVALLLLRLDERVTVVGCELGSASRIALERAGASIVSAAPDDERALSLARIDDASCAVIALSSDLACLETALSIHLRHPRVSLVCHVADLELAGRIESAVGARSAVCTSAIEAVHLAAAAVTHDVIGAFPLGGALCVVRRHSVSHDETVGGFEARTGGRILIMERNDGRVLVAPHPSLPLTPDCKVVVVEQLRRQRARMFESFSLGGARAMRLIRQSTPAPLGWTAGVLILLAAFSVVVFMAGMDITFSDATYLVLNTISTVGYGDITPFEFGPSMRLFGSFVTLLGPALVGTVLLIFARVLLHPSPLPVPEKGHVVIAAAPQVSHAAVSRLRALSVEAITPAAGDSFAASLRGANASKASAIIAATNDPVANLNLALAAREENPSIHVVVRGSEKIATGMSMAVPSSAVAAGVATIAASALVEGVRYAFAIDQRIFAFFEGTAGSEWSGMRAADVAGSYNIMFLYRRDAADRWTRIGEGEPFRPDDTILIAAWRRVEKQSDFEEVEWLKKS